MLLLWKESIPKRIKNTEITYFPTYLLFFSIKNQFRKTKLQHTTFNPLVIVAFSQQHSRNFGAHDKRFFK